MITIVKTAKFQIDIEKERERINKAFDDDLPAQKRQLEILDALEDGDMEKMARLYDSLPENFHNECSEKEYTGLWMEIFFNSESFPCQVSFNIEKNETI